MKIGKRTPGKTGKIYMRFMNDLEENDVIHINREIERLQSQETVEAEVYKSGTSIPTDLGKYYYTCVTSIDND